MILQPEWLICPGLLTDAFNNNSTDTHLMVPGVYKRLPPGITQLPWMGYRCIY